jgi:cell division protein FtsN
MKGSEVLIALIAALVILGIAAVVGITGNKSAEREQQLRLTCTQQGGIWIYGGCVWSQKDVSN